MKVRGFSLIEVMVALSILAVIAAVISPTLSDAVERERFKSSAREIASALRSARQLALSTQAEVVFTIDVSTKAYTVGDGPQRVLRAPPDTQAVLVTATEEQRSGSAGSIRFFADGSSTGGAIAVTREDRTLTVTVDWLTGRIRVE